MREVFRNHREVCHIWASQSQYEGRSGNIDFRGPTIYSYGHWRMARFADKETVLFRDETYSVSTSRHQGLARNAVKHCKVFHVININAGYNTASHAVNICYYRYKMRVMADKFWASINGAQWHKSSYDRTVEEAKDYAKHFRCESLIACLFGLELSGQKAKTKLEKQAETNRIKNERIVKEQAESEVKRAAAKAKIQDQLDRFESDWLGGMVVTYHQSVESDGFRFYNEFTQTRLRIAPNRDNEIETSQGAYVSLEAGKLLYDRIVAGKDVRLHQIGAYQVISYNGELKIGCHVIKREEIDRFALSVGWC